MADTVLPPAPEDAIRLRRFLFSVAVLLLLFCLPLFQLVRFALKSELYSYVLLVPIVSGYLAWLDRGKLSPGGPSLPVVWPGVLAAAGFGLAAWAVLIWGNAGPAARVDRLAFAMYALVCLVAAAACLLLGRHSLRVLSFPLGFLLFLAPLPTAVETGFETLLQHGSSWAAHRFLELAGMPVFREGTLFQLPGFSMQVAPECSGIRSTLALFLTSLVAGQLFLRSPWKRATLALVVLPIALLRNGFRVFVIGELCVQVGPHMIHSWVHRQGGPFFFALSLIPFSLILFYLYRSERTNRSRPTPSP